MRLWKAVVALLLVSPSALAQTLTASPGRPTGPPPPPPRAYSGGRTQWTFGPSLGYLARPNGSLLLSADLTLVPGREGTQWVSIGTRAAFPSDHATLWLPYAEVGMYALANLGVGLTVATGSGQRTAALPHLLVGLPFGQFEKSAWYIEPYYRPCFGMLLGQGGAHHEVGVLFKMGYLSPRPMRLCC